MDGLGFFSRTTLLICDWKPGQGGDDDDDGEYADDAEGEGRNSTAQSPVKRARDREEEDGRGDEGQDIKKVKV